LKIKNTQRDIYDRFSPGNQDLISLNKAADIKCENPNNSIYKFEGTIDIKGMKETISLGPDNLLLRGMNLRNTEDVYGIVVFTGHDTKVMKNSAAAVYKLSKLDLMMNHSILVVLTFQMILAVIAAAVGWGYMSEFKCDLNDAGECDSDMWTPYLPKIVDLDSGEFIILIFTWILIMTNMVPISLMVSLEVVKAT